MYSFLYDNPDLSFVAVVRILSGVANAVRHTDAHPQTCSVSRPTKVLDLSRGSERSYTSSPTSESEAGF